MNQVPQTKPNKAAAWRSNLRSISTVLLTTAVLLTIAFTAWKLNQQHNLYGALTSNAFLIATGLAITYRVANPVGWNLVVRGMGHDVGVLETTRIWLLAESRRWLPGGVWGYASRAIASKAIGLTKTSATASMAIELLATIIAAAIVSLAGVMFYHGELYSAANELFAGLGIDGNLALAVGVLGVAIVTSAWILRHKIVQKFGELRSASIKPNWFIGAVGYLIAMAVLNGAVNSVLLSAVGTEQVPLVAMVSATATAWIIGFFAFFSPGGILVREAALAMLLLPWLPYEMGFTLAILSRFAQLVAEVVGMGLTLRRWPRFSVAP